MDVFRTDRIRNVVLLGHGGAGKTTLAEAIIWGRWLTPAVIKSCSSAVSTIGIAPRELISSVKSEIYSSPTSPPGVRI